MLLMVIMQRSSIPAVIISVIRALMTPAQCYADIQGRRRFYAMSLLRVEDSMKASVYTQVRVGQGPGGGSIGGIENMVATGSMHLLEVC